MTRQEPLVSADDVSSRLSTSWTFNDNWIQREYRTDGWRTTMMLVNAIAYLAEAANHHPDLEVHWGRIVVRLQTHTAGGVTEKDLALAERIETNAAWRGDTGFPGLQGPADGWSIR